MNRIAPFPVAIETLTLRKRRRFPERYARKDARTLALRLAYGPQSKLTTEVTQGSVVRLADAEIARERGRLLQALGLTRYERDRCRSILAAFDRRQARPPEG
jgi:hypothetical protein